MLPDGSAFTFMQGIVRHNRIEEGEVARGEDVLAERPEEPEIEVARPVREGIAFPVAFKVIEKPAIFFLGAHHEFEHLPRRFCPVIGKGLDKGCKITRRAVPTVYVQVVAALRDVVALVVSIIEGRRGE